MYKFLIFLVVSWPWFWHFCCWFCFIAYVDCFRASISSMYLNHSNDKVPVPSPCIQKAEHWYPGSFDRWDEFQSVPFLIKLQPRRCHLPSISLVSCAEQLCEAFGQTATSRGPLQPSSQALLLWEGTGPEPGRRKEHTLAMPSTTLPLTLAFCHRTFGCSWLFLVKRLSAGETGDSRQVTLEQLTMSQSFSTHGFVGTFDGAEGRCNNRQVHSGSLLLLFGHVWFSFEQHWTVTLLIYLIKRYIEVMVIPGWIEIGDYEELPHLEVEAFRFWDMCLSFPIQPVNLYLYCLLSMGFNISCDPRWQVLTCNTQSQRPMRISGRMSCTINILWIAARRPAEILDPVLLCGWHWGNKASSPFHPLTKHLSDITARHVAWIGLCRSPSPILEYKLASTAKHEPFIRSKC